MIARMSYQTHGRTTFQLGTQTLSGDGQARYNIAPGRSHPVIWCQQGNPFMEDMTWGHIVATASAPHYCNERLTVRFQCPPGPTLEAASREALDRGCAVEWERQRRIAEEMANQKPQGERRRKIHASVAVRLNAEQAEMQRARASAREKLLAELRSLPVRERMEHIAWDDTRHLSFYPADLATCSAEHLKQLHPVTRHRLAAKLCERKRGPWHKLAKGFGMGWSESKTRA